MNVSNTGYSSQMAQQMQRREPPSAADLAGKVLQSSDSDGDSLLTIEEIGLSEESFSSLDTDGDGSLSTTELEESLSSKMESMKNKELTPEEFGSFLSELGLEVPPPPQGKEGSMPPPPDASQMASDIFSTKDGDSDGLLSIDELGIDEALFASLDSDEDGSITQEELEKGISGLFESEQSGEISKEELGEALESLGVEAPKGGPGGAPMGAGGGSSEDEEYDEADLNQDGIVSAAEKAIAQGTSTDSSMEEYTLDLVSTLMDALKSEKEENESGSDIELSQFKEIMGMLNSQLQDTQTKEKLDKYLSNLAS